MTVPSKSAVSSESIRSILSQDYVWFRYNRRDKIKVTELSWPVIFKKAVCSRSFRLLVLIRLMLNSRQKGANLTPKIIKRMICRLYLAEISFDAEIGPGSQIPHPQGIIIGGETKIGRFVSIGQHCTLGANFGKIGEQGNRFPVIGDNARILAGSVVVGPITIGAHSVVAPNSVVIRNVGEHTTVSGVPAVPIKIEGQKVEPFSKRVERLETTVHLLEQELRRLLTMER